jgi:E3 ubiquitin-protein ligase HECTD2
MPTWSSRLLPSPPSPRSNQAQQHQPSYPGGLDRSAAVDIDYSVPILRPAAAPRRAHARSVSQPFPSLLSTSGKKKVTKEDFLDSDDDDEVSYIPEPRSGSPRKRWAPAEDWVSGRCMTCNSTVRWPGNVKVFRCTTCLMVNDLEPHVSSNDQVPHDGRPPPPPPKDDSSKFTLPGMSLLLHNLPVWFYLTIL